MSADEDDLEVADEQRLVTLLDEFEAALTDGRQPTIESFVGRVDERLRTTLLADLVRVEQELLPAAQRPTLESYLERFPDDAPVVRSAYGEGKSAPADWPTLAYDEGPTQLPVQMAFGERTSLVAETAELLRIRLRALALMISVALSVFLIRSLFQPDARLIWLRVAALVVTLLCLWRLRIARTQIIGMWRLLELALIAAIGTQMVAVQIDDMVRAAAVGDAVDVNVAMLFAFAAWSVSSIVYAIFIPNTWRRAATILIPAAIVPLAVNIGLLTFRGDVQTMIRSDCLFAGTLLTAIAAAAGIAGTYTVNSLRKQLFLARRFGQYRLTKKLGQGGMGEVYLAEHQMLKRPSAIKLIRPSFATSADMITRFEREVQATATLSHWNTVEIFDYGCTDDGTFYYVMEYLEGASLQELVDRDGPLPPARVVHFLRQICDALAEAHAVGLIHRDIKPGNIFAARCGVRSDVAKLLDFGLVGDVVAADEETETPRNSRVLGSPRFLSPEQARGLAAPDARSDIYSLGATAYSLLTGQPLFPYQSVTRILKAHIHEAVTPLSQANPQVPADLAAVIHMCLEKRPEDRYQNVGELDDALAACSCAGDWTPEVAARVAFVSPQPGS